MPLKIGALARCTGTNTPTIRYYEDIGLLPAADRRSNGQRAYGDDDIKRLTFIRRSREFGFPIEQIRRLMTLMQDKKRSCVEVRDLAKDQLATVRKKMQELKELEKYVAGLVDICEALCLGGPGPQCVVFEDLAVAPKTKTEQASCKRCG